MRNETLLRVMEASDYAVLTVGPVEFYFGYEVTDPANPEEDEDAEWCFRATLPGREPVILPRPVLAAAAGLRERADPETCLLAGIGLLVSRGILQVADEKGAGE